MPAPDTTSFPISVVVDSGRAFWRTGKLGFSAQRGEWEAEYQRRSPGLDERAWATMDGTVTGSD